MSGALVEPPPPPIPFGHPLFVSGQDGYHTYRIPALAVTWKEMPPLGDAFRCVMTFSSMIRLKDGSYAGLYHRGEQQGESHASEIVQTRTTDGGFTWSAPEVIARPHHNNPCEPFVFRSPDGNELCCLLRENLR